ncbi:phosphoesterase [Mycena maculata]|uniref:Phosphoesterase n=1 Tax=Mycena maculata TaxID=230809 RepID=A0AAD7K6R4_9AGAR|nr:phosphoesterase [Mycena maculata]
MGYYAEAEIPTLLDLVDDFTTFNYWFSCIPGPTNPNRLCALSGTSDGHGSNDNDFENSAIDVNSIFETASSRGISWLNYDGTTGAVPDALFYPWTAANAASNVVPLENFFQDAYLGVLPQLSYLNPSCCDLNTNSMHPDGNVSYGQVFVKQIYDAVRQGAHWNDTLFVLTYDESGGFHDHVPSPLAVCADDKTYTETAADGEVYTFKFDRLGGRMPTWLISSYAPQGYVENMGTNPATGAVEAYSATSVLKTFGLLWDFDDFTPRVSNSPSFDHLIGPTMRDNAPLILTPPLPFPAAT